MKTEFRALVQDEVFQAVLDNSTRYRLRRTGAAVPVFGPESYEANGSLWAFGFASYPRVALDARIGEGKLEFSEPPNVILRVTALDFRLLEGF
jgi:hypothetical protein